MPTVASRPTWWPHFSSTLRSTALTARLGLAVGIAFGLCFLTGLLSYYQYSPWSWLPTPTGPEWGYRLTQGIHVTTGIASIPLIVVKLWSVYPDAFRWPPFPSAKRTIERISLALLVAASLVQLVTGLANVLGWYPFPWDFIVVHYALAYVVIGSVLLHVGIKLPDINYGLRARLPDADVLTEIPWNQNPDSHSNAGERPAPPTPGISRRGVLTATGVGVGIVVLGTVGQSATLLEPLGLLAPRQPSRGPLGLPVSKTAEEASVVDPASGADWRLEVTGPQPYALTLAEVEALPTVEEDLPFAANEGWSTRAHWRGPRLLDLVQRAGGTPSSLVRVFSLEPRGPFNKSTVEGDQLARAVLATHLNGQRLSVDHGYPLRLVVPNRAGLFATKWLTRIEVLS
ncbi:MAG TPA: molybdopterin-dependent oxidoreductase [Propionibacteriaceae bacterium]|nr:molybdopterin-dependent oxidoreductase [Propionibacteriaceae bacterium]